jgi:P4 family phage/plasmid primase-like protien
MHLTTQCEKSPCAERMTSRLRFRPAVQNPNNKNALGVGAEGRRKDLKINCKSIYEAAVAYKEEGLDPLPIPPLGGHPAKYPIGDLWPIAALKGHALGEFKPTYNIANLTGGKQHLTDADADSQIAVAIAREMLPKRFPKTVRFGRESKPNSHTIYYADESLPSEAIRDPLPDPDNPKKKGEMLIEFRCVDEDLSRGHETVFPPSIHYDPATGAEELIEFDPSCATISTVVATELRETVRWIGAANMLAKHFPSSGGRHNIILALAGVMARVNKPEDYAIEFICCAYKHSAGFNHDLPKVESDIRGVYQTLISSPDTHLYGYPTLTELLPKKLIDKMLCLLGIETKRTTRSHSGESNGVAKQSDQKQIFHLTDTGNAKWLVHNYAAEIRYCEDTQSWFRFNGKHWLEGDAAIRELAKKRGEVLRGDSAEIEKPEGKKGDEASHQAVKEYEEVHSALHYWAKHCENAAGIRGTLYAASSDPAILCNKSDFDQKHNLLNVQNGVLDLYTGELLPHDASLMLSMICPTEYHPGAKHEVWDSTLEAITRNHPDLLPFLPVFFGYAAQGNKRKELIASLQGPAHTGKGTIITAIRSTLGKQYVLAVAPETVLKQKRQAGAPSGDIERLDGSRIVIVSELGRGNELEDSLLKKMSGNDSITARGNYKNDREIDPTWQFIFQTNHRIGFDSTDSACRRRFIEIPFDNVLTKDPLVTFDDGLKEWMKTDKPFHEAVLAWLVGGCVRWKKEGFHIPASVTEATEDLFASLDYMSDFIAECCLTGPNEKVPLTELHDTFVNFCFENREDPARGKTLNKMLAERGFINKQATIIRADGRRWNGKAFIGIRLKTDAERGIVLETRNPFLRRPDRFADDDQPTGVVDAVVVGAKK